MRNLSLYKEGDSFLHRTTALNKLLYIIFITLTIFLYDSLMVGFLLFLLNLSFTIVSKTFKRTLYVLSFVGIILLTVFIIQGLFNYQNITPLFKVFGLTFYKEGVFRALTISLRMLNLLFSFALLVLTTKPQNLFEELVQRGLPPKFGYVLESVLQIIPQMISKMDDILDAQRSRGLEIEGNLLKRARAFVPLIGPVVISSLISAKERAIALEVRGFHTTKKTFLNEYKDTSFDKKLKVILWLSITISLLWRIVILLWKR